MLDLTTAPDIPDFEIKVAEGDVRVFDALQLFYYFKELDGVQDVIAIRDLVNEKLQIKVTGAIALTILTSLTQHVEKYGEALKNVLGALPSSKDTIPE